MNLIVLNNFAIGNHFLLTTLILYACFIIISLILYVRTCLAVIAYDLICLCTSEKILTETTTSNYSWTPQSEYDCNFDDGFCGWTNESIFIGVWLRSQGFDSNLDTG